MSCAAGACVMPGASAPPPPVSVQQQESAPIVRESPSMPALDTTRNLLSRFAGLTVRLVAREVPEAWRPRILRHEGAAWYIGLASYDDLERLLAELRQTGIRIEELALAETDLEQVFLRIMSEGVSAPSSATALS